jgi:two-component system CheB/CheR fusion protein
LISRANSDLQNLLAAPDFATLFLDSGLNIKRFTDQVGELFSITTSDEGRPITDFAHQL